MPITLDSTRFGRLEIDEASVIEFPAGLIGLEGSRYAIVAGEDDATFSWLHSLEDPALALPVTNPFRFFSAFEVELSDDEAERLGVEDPDDTQVWVTVRAAEDLAGFTANLRAPIIVVGDTGHQVINQAKWAPLRAALFGALATEPVTEDVAC